MDMKLSDEQAQLQEAARRFMDEECPIDFVRRMEQSELGFSREMWKQMAELGWLGIDLPADAGGLELGSVDLTLLMRELGRHLCPVPMLSTAVIAGGAIARAGSEVQRQHHLPKIVDGDLVVGFAYQELTRRFDPEVIALEAREEGDAWRLSGRKMFVEYAAAADLLLVVARTSQATGPGDGLTMFLVERGADGVTCNRLRTTARDHLYEVVLDDVRVPKESVLGRVGGAWVDLEPVLHKAVLAFAAFCNGAAFEMHEQATEFAKQRVQFERPIGQLQSIQGYLAQLIMEILGSDMMTTFTAFNMDRGRHVRGYVAKVKGFSAETVARTMDIGSQIFGGMGYMEEVDSTLYLRRGKQYQLMLGGTDYWYEIAAQEMIDVAEPVLLG